MCSESHPITTESIVKRLRELEKEHDVRILYACESGSRVYGLSHTESDYDIRFLFVRRTEAYLRVGDSQSNSKNNVITLAINGKWDITGWDMRKALVLLRDSNPTLLEWLHSPIVYIGAKNEIVLKMRELAAYHFSINVCIHHYYGVSCWLPLPSLF